MASAFPAIVVYAQELLPGRVGMISGLFFGFAFGMGGIGAAVLGALADAHLHHLCLQGLRLPAGDRIARRVPAQLQGQEVTIEQVARRYAVAVSPHPAVADRSRRSQRSHCAAVPAVTGRAEYAAGRARRSHRRRGPFPGRRHRASSSGPRAVQGGGGLPGLLPLLFPPRDDRARQGRMPCRQTISTRRWPISPPIRKSGK